MYLKLICINSSTNVYIYIYIYIYIIHCIIIPKCIRTIRKLDDLINKTNIIKIE